MWLRACLTIAVTACSFRPGSLNDDDVQPPIDAPADMPPDMLGAICFGSPGSLHSECFADEAAVPTGGYSPPAMFDTDDTQNCSRVVSPGSGPALCVRWAGSIAISAPTRVVGSRAAVFLATDALVISGQLDASSFNDNDLGAAANTGGCSGATAGNPDTGNGASAGGGGGGGGGFGTGGGAGGDGNANGGNGGTAASLTLIRGGCPGRVGGASSEVASGGAGGGGGGVIYLIAKNQIRVAGGVRANGGAGRGAGRKAGAGGGGSGGLIAFDSATLVITGTVFANGGGGGEGGDTNSSGDNGANPTSYNMRASGGSGLANNGGNGGDGSVGAMGGVGGMNGGNGGGGGGGGGGLIKVYPAKPVSGNFSPPPTS